MKPRLSDALLAAQTDERLVALTRAGHERAFAAIVERYRRPLVGFARRIAPDSRAEDVVQQALTSAWAALAAGAEVAHLRGWLHQIVRHEAIRLARQEGRAIADPLAGEEPLARDAAEEAAERERVRDAFAGIAGLPASQREALVQTTLAGHSRSEVAAALGLSEGAVRQLVHRARAALRTAATALTPLPLASWAASLGGGGSAAAGLAEVAAGVGGATFAGSFMKTGVAVVATGALATGVTVTEHRRDRPPPAQQQARGADTAAPPAVRAAGRAAADGSAFAPAGAAGGFGATAGATPVAFGGAAHGASDARAPHRRRPPREGDGGERDRRAGDGGERDRRDGDGGGRDERERDGRRHREDDRHQPPAAPRPSEPAATTPAGDRGRDWDGGRSRDAERRRPGRQGGEAAGESSPSGHSESRQQGGADGAQGSGGRSQHASATHGPGDTGSRGSGSGAGPGDTGSREEGPGSSSSSAHEAGAGGDHGAGGRGDR